MPAVPYEVKSFLEGIKAGLQENKEKTKGHLATSVEQENWKQVEILSEIANQLDQWSITCSQTIARLEVSGVGAETTAKQEPSISSGIYSNQESRTENHPHPFWPTFFKLGKPFHPELANKTPTGGGRKIGPTILPGIQIDVAYSTRGVSCRLLSSNPEKLKPILKMKRKFEEAVVGPVEWNDGKNNRSHLSVTVRPASTKEQQAWNIEKKASKLLALYGQIKEFVFKNLK